MPATLAAARETIADDARAWATTYAEIVRERRKVRVP